MNPHVVSSNQGSCVVGTRERATNLGSGSHWLGVGAFSSGVTAR